MHAHQGARSRQTRHPGAHGTISRSGGFPLPEVPEHCRRQRDRRDVARRTCCCRPDSGNWKIVTPKASAHSCCSISAAAPAARRGRVLALSCVVEAVDDLASSSRCSCSVRRSRSCDSVSATATAVDCQPNSEASYSDVVSRRSGPHVGLLPSMTLKPAWAAESRISSYSLARRGLLAANRKRTSIGVVDAGLLEQRLSALDVDLGVLGRAVLGDDGVVRGRAGNRRERVAQLGLRVQRHDQPVDDLLAGDRLEERLAHRQRRLLVTAVRRRVERAAVVEDQVDVLVRAAVAGLDLDAAVGERLAPG